jgi:dipeptidyl aminopeptidase/acylaminoacyl peptidase
VVSANPSTAGGRFSVFRMTLQKGSKPEVVASAATGDVSQATLSPDGRWLAYTSTESGRNEIYVQAFASGGGRLQVSNAGGAEPRWAADGRALYYVQADSLMRVPVEPGPTFSPGKPQALFGGLLPPVTDSGQTYAVAPKGERFLVLRPARENAGPPEVRVVLNWFDELRAVMIGK